MNRRDDSDSHDTVDADEVDALLDHLMAGGDPRPDGPAWSRNVALLVRAAEAPAGADELSGEADIVRRMIEVRTSVEASRTTAVATVTRLDDHRSRAGDDPDRLLTDDRHYRAKHAAARLEASRHPALRTVGRVIAMKAAAVTAVAFVGVAAAAAATTGIVATVVVPALTEKPVPEADPQPTISEKGRQVDPTPGARPPSPADEPAPAPCPMAPACLAPPTTASVSTTTTALPTTPTTEGAATSPDDRTGPTTTTTAVESTTTTTESTTLSTMAPTTTTTADTTPDPGLSALADQGEAP